MPTGDPAEVNGVQIGITLTGQICLYTGLRWGVSPDNLVWRWTHADHPMEPWELVLGDGIYGGACPAIVPIPSVIPSVISNTSANNCSNELRSLWLYKSPHV